MGKDKKGFNRKARQVVEVTTDDSFKNKVRVEVDRADHHRYDDANPLVLPSKKRKSVVKKHKVQTVKLLSKNQRKRYEKIVEKKKKNEEKAALLEALSKVQATPELLSKLTSITEIQTKGRKRMCDNTTDAVDETKSTSKRLKLNAIKGNRYSKIARLPRTTDPNVVGFESSDSESKTDSEGELTHQNDEQDDVPLHRDETLKPTNSDETEGASKSKNPDMIEIDSDDPNEDEKENTEKEVSEARVIVTESSKETPNPAAEKTFVPVHRDRQIQRLRSKLPIIGEEQTIMEAISTHDVVIIAGETGSGKTTQLPQFLYEAGYSLNGRLIGVTEPRRVAAVSMSRRVAEELGLTSEEVSYLIRFEGNTTPKTQIKFMTDGVLLKEIQKDFLLSKYSVIILDEAHERSVFTDILMGLLSRITPLRRKRNNPLKLIIMSATLRLTDFTENSRLFKVPPPVIKVDARQYPVTVHFNKRTATDYLKEAFAKACKIHAQLPEGGILIFLTGQQEVNTLVKRLRRTFPLENRRKPEGHILKAESEIKKEGSDAAATGEEDASNGKESDDGETSSKWLRHKLRKLRRNTLPEINLDDYATKPTEDEMELYETDDELDDDLTCESVLAAAKCQPMWVLPLYSLLPSQKQAKVFDAPPPGCRLCVVATNVAETSLTIPHVKYVIDCGRTKVRLYDKLTGVSAFTVTWTSKASADQRAGRAGRTAAGHCYRLYSSAIFNDEFADWSVPEIQRKPVDDLLLQMKALRIDRVVNFPFPSPPDALQLRVAEKRLTLLGALQQSVYLKDEWSSKLTTLGESMAAFPVAPRFAKMLCLSQQHELLPYTVAIVATLSVQQFLLAANDHFGRVWRTWAGVGNSLLLGDVMVLLRALGAAEHASTTAEGVENFCGRCGLRYKAVLEARKLRVQLTNELNLNVPNLNLAVDPRMPPPTDVQARQLRQIMMAGMVDQVAYKLSDDELKQAGLSIHKAAYRLPELEEIIYLNATSVLRKVKPPWIIYQEVYQHNEKLFARGVTAIEPEWLPVYAAPLCNISEPLNNPPPFYEFSTGRVMCSVSSTYGRSGWQLPIVEIEYPAGEDRFKWFAQFLLEGLVCPKLSEYVEHLLSPPNTVFKTWARYLMGRTNVLIAALTDKQVDSKDKLAEQWAADPKYLLNAYLEWLPQSAHSEVKSWWPPL